MLGLGAVLLTSCDQDIVNEIYLPGGGGSVVVTDSTSTKQLQVFTNLEMLQPTVSTRAVDNQWELNDMIGISSTGMINNMKFTRSGGTNQFVSANKVFFHGHRHPHLQCLLSLYGKSYQRSHRVPSAGGSCTE